MNSETLHTAPKALRLAVARALVDKATGGSGEFATAGEGAAAQGGRGGHGERVNASINRIGMAAAITFAGCAGHAAAADAGTRYVTMKVRTLRSVSGHSRRPARSVRTK